MRDIDILPENPKPSDSLANPTPHKWDGGWGYDTTECSKCRVNLYETDSVPTKFCEDKEWGKVEYRLRAERNHRETQKALEAVRKVVTKEQWKLLKLDSFGEHREIDRITV